jgi:hypothetical protein
VSLARRLDLMSGLGPTAEILSFAPPKESIQRKGDPDAACFLRSSLLPRVGRRGFLAPPPTCGIRETSTGKLESFHITFGFGGVAPNSEAYSDESRISQAFFSKACLDRFDSTSVRLRCANRTYRASSRFMVRVHNVELTGVAQLYREASSDQRERG